MVPYFKQNIFFLYSSFLNAGPCSLDRKYTTSYQLSVHLLGYLSRLKIVRLTGSKSTVMTKKYTSINENAF